MVKQRFEFWRESLLMALMIAVLVLSVLFFDSLWPFGDEGIRTIATITGAN